MSVASQSHMATAAVDCIPANSHSYILSTIDHHPNLYFFFFVIGTQVMIILLSALTYSLIRFGPHRTRSIISLLPELVSLLAAPENDIDQPIAAETESEFAEPENDIDQHIGAGIEWEWGASSLPPSAPRMSYIPLPDVPDSPMFQHDSISESLLLSIEPQWQYDEDTMDVYLTYADSSPTSQHDSTLQSILAGSEPQLEMQYDEDIELESAGLDHLVTFDHFASGTLQETVFISLGVQPTASTTNDSDDDLSTSPSHSIQLNSPLPGLNALIFTNDATTEATTMELESSLRVTPDNFLANFGNDSLSTPLDSPLPGLTSTTFVNDFTMEAGASTAEIPPPVMDVSFESEPASCAERSSAMETETGDEEHLKREGDFDISTLKLSPAQWANLKTISLTKCELSGADLITILRKSTGLTKLEVDCLTDANFGILENSDITAQLMSLKLLSKVDMAPLFPCLNLENLRDITVSLPHDASDAIMKHIPWESDTFRSFKIDGLMPPSFSDDLDVKRDLGKYAKWVL